MIKEALSTGDFFKLNLETPMLVFGEMTGIEFADKCGWNSVYGSLSRIYGAYPDEFEIRADQTRIILEMLRSDEANEYFSYEEDNIYAAKWLESKIKDKAK